MRLAIRHPSDGDLRLLQDRSLDPSRLAGVERHLAACPRCQARAHELQQRAQRLQDALSSLDPDPQNLHPTELPAARNRLARQIELEKEKPNMNNTIFARLPRLAWAAIVLIFVLAIALTFEPVRALANDFLGLFRVEQIRVVEFDPDEINQQFENSSQLEYFLSNEVNVEEKGEAQEFASAEEAAAQVDFPLRLPAGLEGEQKFFVQPGANLSFTVDLDLVRAILKDLDRDDIALPDGLDGANIQVEVPTGVAATYGDCSFVEPEGTFDPDNPEASMPDLEGCVTLFQSPSPLISAPPELDLTQIGEAYLQLLGMDADEAAAFASSVNWATTFVIPLPRNYAQYEQVDLNGTQATLVYSRSSARNEYTLVWVRDGIVYALSGSGTKLEAINIAETIQ